MTPSPAPSIIWIASYPGSGNTWMRVLLSNLIAAGTAPVDINDLPIRKHAASRAWFDAHAGVASADLTDSEIAEWRPDVYEAASREDRGLRFVKIHDACGRTPSGRPLVPPAATAGAIYVVRNPLDVAIAYAYHRDVPVDAAIDMMADDDHCLESTADGLRSQVSQRVGSWSRHVLSWIDEPSIRRHIVRFEDLKRDPVAAFGATAAFAGLRCSRTDIERATAFSAFGILERQEAAAGFLEGSVRARRFFRRGDTGQWRDTLTRDQVQRIVGRHRTAMERVGYLVDEETHP